MGHKMRKTRRLLLLLSLLLLPIAAVNTPTHTAAQRDVCPQIVRQALASTETMCLQTGRNQACYGHLVLEAKPQPHITQFEFDSEGDLADVDKIQTLRLSMMDELAGTWGIGLMRLQTNLPGKNITLVFFGDVEFDNTVTIGSTLDVDVEATGNVNVRQSPSLNARVVGTLVPGQTVTANGRLADGSWVRVNLPGEAGFGWVAGWLLASEDDLDDLSVVEESRARYGPMQAFYFRSGKTDAVCSEAPNSGFLVQTPEGIAEVTLLINEVDIQLGSTVYFQAQPSGDMSIRVIEGTARVTTSGTTYTAPAGYEITVPLSVDLKPAGPPTPPTVFEAADVQGLPLSLLERPVDVVLADPDAPIPVPQVNTAPVAPAAPEPVETEVAPEPVAPAPEEPPAEAKMVICHNGVTIEISVNAWPAHQAHGDTEGPCPEP